jgi:hypothetical protein
LRQRKYNMEIRHLCSREHKFLYVLFPVMLCLIIGAAMFGEHFRKNTT